jgi:hypothetical protein
MIIGRPPSGIRRDRACGAGFYAREIRIFDRKTAKMAASGSAASRITWCNSIILNVLGNLT